MQYKKVFYTRADAADALAYIADFRSLTEWEPSVLSAEQTRGQGPGVHARYQIRMRFMGRESGMTYTCTEYVDAHAILLGQGDGFTATDRIDVRALSTGCEVTYFTDIRLTTGLGRVLAPLIRVIFGFNVRRAVKNLRARLDGRAGMSRSG